MGGRPEARTTVSGMDWLLAYVDRWHDTYEVVGAVATAAAVVIALWAGIHEVKGRRAAERDAAQARLERDTERANAAAARRQEEREQHERERRRQALRVIAWHDTRNVREATEEEFARPDFLSRQAHILYVVNHSDAPIFDLTTFIRWDEEPNGIVITRPVLPAGASAEGLLGNIPMTYYGQISAYCTFRDLAGVHWRRDQDGSLVELPSAASLAAQREDA